MEADKCLSWRQPEVSQEVEGAVRKWSDLRLHQDKRELQGGINQWRRSLCLKLGIWRLPQAGGPWGCSFSSWGRLKAKVSSPAHFEGLTSSSLVFHGALGMIPSNLRLTKPDSGFVKMGSSASNFGWNDKPSSYSKSLHWRRDVLLLLCHLFHISVESKGGKCWRFPKLSSTILLAPGFPLIFLHLPCPSIPLGCISVLRTLTLCCHHCPNTHLFIYLVVEGERNEGGIFWKHFVTCQYLKIPDVGRSFECTEESSFWMKWEGGSVLSYK